MISVTFSDVAEAHVEEAYQWLGRMGISLAERWLFLLQMELQSEADRIESGIRRPLASESETQRRDIYALLLRTGGRGSSPWRILYEVTDTDHDGVIDCLTVLRVRHASSE
jgi:plasmid stabilization system protein ParE